MESTELRAAAYMVGRVARAHCPACGACVGIYRVHISGRLGGRLRASCPDCGRRDLKAARDAAVAKLTEPAS